MKPQMIVELEEWGLRVSRLIELVALTNQTLQMHRESGDSWLMIKQYEELLAERQQELDELLKLHGLTLKVVPAETAA
ncbi:hypothetical protein SAMN04487996_105238 [Dyadobacter soli]|uniref:Uncharacterized protein n=1 Tax=Dyadobacter soli TaxID=659014 RepID=A0A1G7DHD7_9BACT|nr:hypothetical protein [Dyadobacter soli]SDE50869.1 hypothetical protein SAMN04487996_105238 [Dyadobacter soli]